MPLKPPSRVEKVTFPVMGFAWWADPSSGRSISVYAGGGGRSRTGIPNIITIQDGDCEKVHISTGDEVGEICRIAFDPSAKALYLFVSFVRTIRRYHLPSGALEYELKLQDKEVVTALAVNCDASRLAVGFETGVVKMYHLENNIKKTAASCIDVKEDHSMSVSAIDFSLKGGRLITGSKDGTACVYQEGELLCNFRSSIDDPTPTIQKGKNPSKFKPPPRALVRAALFLDWEGRTAITVASPVRGQSSLSRWQQQASDKNNNNNKPLFECFDRAVVAPHPISAINLSLDGTWLAWGTAAGAVTLWSVSEWKKLHEWTDVHDFSVTALAARPFPGVPLQGEDDGLQIHVRTVSADLTIGYLTMMRRIPRPARIYGQRSFSSSFFSAMDKLQRLIKLLVIALILSPIVREAHLKCKSKESISSILQCIRDDVLIAPHDRPGICISPH